MNKRLRIAIITKFGTQSDFSLRIGVHESMVSQIIRGRRQLPDGLKAKWAEALNCPQEHLFNDEGVNHRGANGRVD